MNASSDVTTNGRAAAVEDEDEDDIEAGPELPPDGLDDVPDDEDGRFFGGGINKNTAEVLDYIEGRDEDNVVRQLNLSRLDQINLLSRTRRSLTCHGYESLQ